MKMNGELKECIDNIDNLEHNKTQDFVGATLQAMQEKIESLEAELKDIKSKKAEA